MNLNSSEILPVNRVFCAQVPSKTYGTVLDSEFSELPKWARQTTALAALRSLLAASGLDRDHLGSPEWNPLSIFINEDKKVVLKPNWVYHENGSGYGLDCLVTHASVLEAILHYVVKARPRSMVLGDAPIQGCDFTTLMNDSGASEMVDRFSKNGMHIEVKDFRRTIHPDGKLGTRAREECKPLDDFILYNVGAESSLRKLPSRIANSASRCTIPTC